MKTTSPTDHDDPDPHSPSEIADAHSAATQLEVYETERLAFTDAATAPPPSKRKRTWLAAMKCWVLSRM